MSERVWWFCWGFLACNVLDMVVMIARHLYVKRKMRRAFEAEMRTILRNDATRYR